MDGLLRALLPGQACAQVGGPSPGQGWASGEQEFGIEGLCPGANTSPWNDVFT